MPSPNLFEIWQSNFGNEGHGYVHKQTDKRTEKTCPILYSLFKGSINDTQFGQEMKQRNGWRQELIKYIKIEN